MIDTHSINNNEDINLTCTTKIQVTPANGNPMKEKGKMNNTSPHVQTIQTKEQPLTEQNIGGRKLTGKKARKYIVVPHATTYLAAISKETQPEGETEQHNHTAESMFAEARGLKEGEDSVSMILDNDDSKGDKTKVVRIPFFCTQKHNPKTVGVKNSTICTVVDMKDFDSKSYLKYYNLTHQTYSVKSKKCIFVSGEYSRC